MGKDDLQDARTQGEDAHRNSGAGEARALAKVPVLIQARYTTLLEGLYFSFDQQKSKQDTGARELRQEGIGYVIEPSSSLGRPSVLAYKILQAVFLAITLKGRPYRGTVELSQPQLARMVGRKNLGGNDSRQLAAAIRQLQETRVERFLYAEKTGERLPVSSQRFEFVLARNPIAEGLSTSPRSKSIVLTLHPIIMEDMQKHYVIFNMTRLRELEPLASAIYKRLFYHLSNLYKNQLNDGELCFKKQYRDICTEWLGGLTQEEYKSRIQKQLGQCFKDLQSSGLVRSVMIERAADGIGFTLTFKPGPGFFEDYEQFYVKAKAKRPRQVQKTAERVSPAAELKAVRTFFKLSLGASEEALDEMSFNRNDIAQAQRMIKQFGEDAVHDLIKFALAEAPRNFKIQTLGGVMCFQPAWQAQRAARLAAQEADANQRRKAQLEAEHHRLMCEAISKYRERCTIEEREELWRLAAEKIEGKYAPSNPMRKRMLAAHEHILILARCDIPSLEVWLQSRGYPPSTP